VYDIIIGMSVKQSNFKEFKAFLSNECFDLEKYKAGKYDRKIYDWFMKKKSSEYVKKNFGDVIKKMSKD